MTRSESAQRAIDYARDMRAYRMTMHDLDACKHSVVALRRAHGDLQATSYWQPGPDYGMFRLHWWERIWHGVRLRFD